MPLARIFVIEDNPSDVYIQRPTLADQGEDFELEVAFDGEEALRFVHRQRQSRHDMLPCVILLDLHLPKHNGIEVLKAIQQEPVLSHIHVVVLTNLASPQERAELRRLGADLRPKPAGLAEMARLAGDLIAFCKGLQPIA